MLSFLLILQLYFIWLLLLCVFTAWTNQYIFFFSYITVLYIKICIYHKELSILPGPDEPIPSSRSLVPSCDGRIQPAALRLKILKKKLPQTQNKRFKDFGNIEWVIVCFKMGVDSLPQRPNVSITFASWIRTGVWPNAVFMTYFVFGVSRGMEF